MKYSEEFLDVRGGGKYSKAKAILDFKRRTGMGSSFRGRLLRLLKDKGVKVRDVMSNVRRFERKGLELRRK